MLLKLGWYWTPQTNWNHGAWFEIIDGKLHSKSATESLKLIDDPLSKASSFWDLSDSIVLPGFINSHCHLELSSLQNKIEPTKSFSQWVSKLQALVINWSDTDWEQSYLFGLEESLKSGTTRILDVANRDWSVFMESYQGVQVRLQKEILGLNPNDLKKIQSVNSDFLEQAKISGDELIPHAPFSCSSELISWIVAQADWLNLHLSESREEAAFFNSNSGPLWDFVERIYPDIQVNSKTPYSHVFKNVLTPETIPNRVLITHGNTLTSNEIDDCIKQGYYLSHCPGSRAYFEHPQQAWAQYIDSGLKVCIGTDSLASTSSLSLWDELTRLTLEFPSLSEPQVLAMVTKHPAEIMNLPDEGCIRDGAQANFQILESWVEYSSVHINSQTPNLSTINYKPTIQSVVIQGVKYEQ